MSDSVMTFWVEPKKMSNDGFYFVHDREYNADATIQNTDSDDWRLDPSVLRTYRATDGNLDGVVQATDYDLWWLNKAKIGAS